MANKLASLLTLQKLNKVTQCKPKLNVSGSENYPVWAKVCLKFAKIWSRCFAKAVHSKQNKNVFL